MTKIIFFNIGWMQHYEGLRNDKIIGGGKHIANEGWGGEVFNFKNKNGNCYGYVQPKISSSGDAFSSTIRIERIGAKSSDSFIENVLVIFTSKDPINKGTRVVGWYKNAIVYRNSQYLKDNSRRYMGNDLPYFVKAKYSDVVLLPIDSRVEMVPRGKKGMGQSNVWYCEENELFKKHILKIVEGKLKIGSTTRGTINVNIDRKIEVEKKAINFVSNYYANLGYDVFSVEKDNLGWDLEIKKAKEILLVEVKGLSGEFVSVDFSPNEYSKMCDKVYQSKYRIAVVSKALNQNLEFNLFNFSKEKSSWICQLTNRVVNIEERISAKLKII